MTEYNAGTHQQLLNDTYQAIAPHVPRNMDPKELRLAFEQEDYRSISTFVSTMKATSWVAFGMHIRYFLLYEWKWYKPWTLMRELREMEAVRREIEAACRDWDRLYLDILLEAQQ